MGDWSKQKFSKGHPIFLHKVKVMQGYKLGTMDGEIGNVKDFYFDDQHWTVRYMVVNTGNWLSGRQVLISPYSMVTVDEFEKTIVTQLTKKQIEDSPSLEKHKPISRRFEMAYCGYYGWPAYCYGGYNWGAYRRPLFSGDKKADLVKDEAGWEAGWEADMRSTKR
ncbi:MAG: hypothetical protein ACI8V2_000678 [Candidatus Latescibacterota bacterium]|jgi:hypothetical protein